MQILGFALIGIGVLCFMGLIVWGIIKVLSLIFGAIPIIVTVIIACVGAGILILIGVAIKDRLTKGKSEDFKEVDN